MHINSNAEGDAASLAGACRHCSGARKKSGAEYWTLGSQSAAGLSHTRAPPPEGGGEAVVLGQSDEKYDTMRSILVQEAPLVAARHCCKTWLRLVKLREATNISA